ncbi:hypothetical protein WI36_13725 [Burkholderia ubonensis]|uniref:Uncharacterized protein n=2 Tax=Burkholderia ubonensis TaxID=101571 RepID=A0A102LVK7_9BURK|nr:hypothetical protein WI35_26475 [Burkholderia ubonensis]KUZ74518.1 hypothetical protein WI36_13725 [Burkholderia ubonensis]KUZ82048.1 hypothetical protein WI38_32060 [Burkholderia ubonensis]KVA00648.1 hypothetical protein WI39_04990 [Burkholderia ubonensis]KVA22345.1 hypothetical protein WI42_09375 [Burkholderia ubonensis]
MAVRRQLPATLRRTKRSPFPTEDTMLLNLLAADPKNTAEPTRALAHAAKQLQQAAATAGAATAQPDRTTLKLEIIKLAGGVNGMLKGPVQEIPNRIDHYLDLAIREQYNFANEAVKLQFAYFMLSIVTDGFVGQETGGTTMGNFRGEWRGGGFKN